jgi:PPIC-type PPIASE domain
MRWLAMMILAACGSQPAAPETRVGPPAAFVAQPAPGDVIVATVDGTPIYGSCVQGQAARGADRKTALEQCIDLELLAHAATPYAADPEVALATHTAMVSQLVGQVYEDGYTKPEQFGGNWQMFVGKNLFRVRHEAYRASTYVRIVVPDKASPQQDADAHAMADKIAAAVAGERGLVGPDFVAMAQQIAGPIALAHEDIPAYRAGALDEHYAQALFAITEVGRASAAVRTKWGWDVIAFTDDVPAADPSDDEVATALMPDVKRGFFNIWTDRLRKALGVRVELVPQNVDKLESLP